MEAGISAAFISAAVGATSAAGISVAGATSALDRRLARLRGRLFAVIDLSRSITPDQMPCGR
jgi:hypothetical protein